MRPALFLFLLAAIPLQAQFTFAPINVPGAVATQARGLNANGEVAGFYQTVACNNFSWQVPNCATKGSKYVNGSYIKLMVPGSLTTAIMGLNEPPQELLFASCAALCPHDALLATASAGRRAVAG